MEAEQPCAMLDPAANGMNMSGDDRTAMYDDTTSPCWGHYFAFNQYPLDNTNMHYTNFMANVSPTHAGCDTTTSPAVDLTNNWHTSSPYATQPSFYSGFPIIDASNSPASTISRRESTATKFEDRSSKRAAESKEKPTRKQPRRTSTRQKSMADESKSQTRPKSKAKTKSKLKPEQKMEEDVEMEESKVSSRKSSVATPKEEEDEMAKKIQERNRVASNKFRVKKREDAKQLKIQEHSMKEVNRDLSGCVAELTLEVYNLKMRLLQHTDCNCHLIQDYIASEAQRYIKDLGEEKTRNEPSRCLADMVDEYEDDDENE